MHLQKESCIVSAQPSINLNQDIALEGAKTFSEAGLNSYLSKCYQRLGYVRPTPIQFYSISSYLQAKPHSIIAHSKSGTGKTLSYLSILLTHLLTMPQVSFKCSFLIILPTRELALQVHQTFKQIIDSFNGVKAEGEEQRRIKIKLMGMRSMLCIGGIPFEDDRRNYSTNGGTVLVGTVGRLLEFLDKKLIKPNQLEMVILDEGDKLFQNKNAKLSQFLENTLKLTDNNGFRVRLLIYSATFTNKLIRHLHKQRNYTYIQTLAQKDGLKTIITTDASQLVGLDSIVDQGVETSSSVINLENIKKYKVCITHESQSYFNAKIAALVQILNELSYHRCLVFVEKKTLLEQINQRLIQAQLEPLLIHGSLSQSSRIKLMNQINNTKIVVASDLLARGIDLELDLVVLFDAKKNDTFWHRIGRTGRFGNLGVAISLDNIEDWPQYQKDLVQSQLNSIENKFKKNKEWYGTYLTEVGRWNETTQEKQIALERQFNYFDENTYQRGRKRIKKNQDQRALPEDVGRALPEEEDRALPEGIGRHKGCLWRLQSVRSPRQMKQIVRQVLGCSKCIELMQSISELTGYEFKIQKYLDCIQ